MTMGNPEGKSTALIAYITLVGAIIAIFMNQEPKHEFARFHIRQAFGLHLVFHGLAIVLSNTGLPFAWVFLYLVFFGLWLFALIGATQNQRKELPLLGSYFQKWFTFIS